MARTQKCISALAALTNLRGNLLRSRKSNESCFRFRQDRASPSFYGKSWIPVEPLSERRVGLSELP